MDKQLKIFSGRSKSTSWRLQISEDILDEYNLPDGTIYQYEMNKIIDAKKRLENLK